MGFLGELLDSSTDYWVVDGAQIPLENRLSRGWWQFNDLDHDEFGRPILRALQRDHVGLGQQQFDTAFCLETLEHLSNPYHCLSEIKKLVKIGGDVFLSVPTESVTHNVVYPGLLWPFPNFQVFLEQMALPVRDFYVYQPTGRGWPAYQFKCENRPWSEKVPLFQKSDAKFRSCTMLEMTNL